MPDTKKTETLEAPAGCLAGGRESLWRMTAWIAGVFFILVAGIMIFGYAGIRRDDPLKSVRLKEYRQALQQNPTDENLKTSIRRLDLELRTRYFRHLSRTASGVYLLLGGVVIFVLAIAEVRILRKQLPMPKPRVEGSESAVRAAKLSRWFVAGTGATIGVLLFLLSISLTRALPKGAGDIERLLGTDRVEAAPSDAASLEELKQNWPRFRGPDGGGVSPFTNVPAMWDGNTGAGVAWKIATPAGGFCSPIVWGERVFFTGSSENERTVFCLHARTGQTLWRQTLASAAGVQKETAENSAASGFATATMASDGQRVYAFFGSGDLAAFTLEGKPIWSKGLGPLKNAYGHAASLAMWHERLILQLDQGEAEEGKSKLYAFDGRKGQILWQRPRRVGSSWATPIVIEAAGKAQVITLAVPWVIAYAAADGTELWRVQCLNGEITPSPIFSAGLVFVASPSEKLLAIRPDGTGDVTKTHVIWTTEENVPDITSPVCSGELVFALTSSGILTCFDVKDGKKQWEHDFGMEFHSSPGIADNRLYLTGQKGTAVVVEVARQFKEISRTEMGDEFHASPAFMKDRIILRGETNIWCIGAAVEKLANK